MASPSVVARNIRLFRDRALGAAALSAVLAKAARGARDELVRSGAAPPSWRTFVDGREGASEDSVRPDGVVLYRFNLLPAAVDAALTHCRNRSPVDSGNFKKAWFVMVDGQRWTGALDAIPADATVFVTNDQPYARKIDTGAMRVRVAPGIVEDARQAIQRRYPNLSVERDFILIPGGYVLKGRGRSRRKDRQAGQVLTYPALVLRAK